MLLALRKVIHHKKMQPWYLWNPGWIYAIGKHCQSLEMDMLVYRITFLSFSISLRAPPVCFFHTGTYSALRLTSGNKCWRLHYNGNKHIHNSDNAHPKSNPICGPQWSLQQKEGLHYYRMNGTDRWGKFSWWHLSSVACRTVGVIFSEENSRCILSVWWIQTAKIIQRYFIFLCCKSF